MLDPKTQQINDTLQVHRKKIVIDVSEASDERLVFELSPIEDLESKKEIEVKGSIWHAVQNDSLGLRDFLGDKLYELKEKFNKFEHSPTYLSHLSALSELLGDLDGSEHFLKKAISVGGDANLFGNKLGRNLLLNNRPDDALDVFRNLDLTVNVEANLRLGYLSVIANRFDDAIQYVNTAMKIDASHYGSRVFAGGLAIWKGEYEAAIRHFRVAISERPNSSTAYANLAAAYACLGHFGKAISSLKKAISIDPLNHNAVIFYADLLFHEKKNNNAIEPLLYFVKYNSEAVDAWERLGRACYFSGQYGKAINALVKQAEIIGYNSSIWNNLGLAHWKAKKHEKAASFFRNALEAQDDNGCSTDVSLSNYCWFLIERRKYDEVIQLTSQALPIIEAQTEKTKHEEILLLQHCVGLEGKGSHDESYEKLNRLLISGVNDIEVRVKMLLHTTYYLTTLNKNSKEANYNANQLLELLIKHRRRLDDALVCRGFNNVMFTYLEFDELEKAEMTRGYLSKYYHNDPYATATLGLFYIKNNLAEKGLMLYEEAVSLVADQKMKRRIRQRMHLELGFHYQKLGDERLAIRHLHRAIDHKFGYEYVSHQAQELIRVIR